LTNGTTYYYKVTAVNGAGESAMSAEVSVTPKAGLPAAPTGVAATAGNTTATITWTAVSGATSYNVYRGTSAGNERATAWKTGITSPTFTNTGLTNGTAYYYTVTAVNGIGESPMSSEVSVTPAP
jgi:fibronectin type 3 domain-containing protein